MATKSRPWTRRDLDRLPNDGNSYEIVRGELFVTPAPSAGHQALVRALAVRLAPYVTRYALGELDFPRSVVVIGESEVEPDLMVRPAVPAPPPRWEDAPLPTLIVEVLSDATRRRDLVAKRSLYLASGIAEYWIVDGDRRTMTVVRPGEKDVIATDRLRWSPSPTAEPLEIDVAALFRVALG